MRLHYVPLDQIVSNPWRDEDLYPITDEQIAALRASIKDHDFFATLKGRRRNGKVEIACGHARVKAARRARLETIPIFIDDMDDDEMLRLMVDENATQRGGTNAGAVMNEVAAVTKRLIEGLADTSGTIVPDVIRRAFGDKVGVETARTRLRNGAFNAIGHNVIRAYLGGGDPNEAKRAERQIREAVGALKQSGVFDEILQKALRKFPEPTEARSESKSITASAPKPKPSRVLDERTANLFPNDHQFHAFREAVTTPGAQRAIPVSQQYALAKEIMKAPATQKGGFSGATNKQQIGAPYIKKMVQTKVEEGLKQQREIDREERERYLAEQIEERISAEVSNASSSLRGLLSALKNMERLAEQFPDHPKLGGFSARLDDLVNAIKQFSRKLNRRAA